MSIAIILDEPENPDNIGAAARSMKNMGLKEMRLVSPPENWLYHARTLAVGAADLLEKAQVYDTIQDALADRHLVIGTTRRLGNFRRAHIEFDDAMARVQAEHRSRRKAAVLFGKESKGLSNESLRLCDWFATIPTSPDYPSINLAQAVMIVCYSLFNGSVATQGYQKWAVVTKQEFEQMMSAFNDALRALEYKAPVAERIDHTFRDLVKRSGVLKPEAQMFLGLSRRICERSGSLYKNMPARVRKTRKPPAKDET